MVTLILYWPVAHHEFINYDDDVYVTANAHVQGGLTLSDIKWAFGHAVSANWHPVTMLSHMLDCELFGLEPWGHHLTNVLLHTFNTVLVFLLLHRLTGAVWRSLMVAALFGWHPLHVESVAWVAERKDVLSTAFGLLALIFYAQYAKDRGERIEQRGDRKAGVKSLKSEVTGIGKPGPDGKAGGRFISSSLSSLPCSTPYWLALFCFALGLMSKAMLVTWPFVMLLLDYWPLGRFKRNCIWALAKEKMPFFALASVASMVTFMVQKHSGAVMSTACLPPWMRCENALVSYFRYLNLLFWPKNLAVFYPLHPIWSSHFLLFSGVFLGGLSLMLFLNRLRYPFMLMGWCWFIGTLVPVIGLIKVGDQAMADRYTYIPSLGIFILSVWGTGELTRHWRYQGMILSLMGSAATVFFIVATRQQLGYWQDSQTLFQHALAVTKNNYIARESLANALFANGQTDAAISQYQEVVRLKPNYAKVRNNLGNALLKQGNINEAISQLQRALDLRRTYADAHNNLGLAFAREGKIDMAIGQLQEAIRLKPDYADAKQNLAEILELKNESNPPVVGPLQQ